MLPTNAQERKDTPVITGVFDYFPDAISEIAKVSKAGNDQHNPGQPLHWAKEKSRDHADALGRHLMERGKIDSDGMRHSAKLAWRALALLQEEIEQELACTGQAQNAKYYNEANEQNAQSTMGKMVTNGQCLIGQYTPTNNDTLGFNIPNSNKAHTSTGGRI